MMIDRREFIVGAGAVVAAPTLQLLPLQQSFYGKAVTKRMQAGLSVPIAGVDAETLEKLLK